VKTSNLTDCNKILDLSLEEEGPCQKIHEVYMLLFSLVTIFLEQFVAVTIAETDFPRSVFVTLLLNV
jgi:hypothetical protein